MADYSAALGRGRAERALALLRDSARSPQVTVALTKWAQLLDHNRYLGDVGAESVGDSRIAEIWPQCADPTTAMHSQPPHSV
ncbi:MAG: hypothetical protein ACRDOY_08115 [Nocardioidaceae bacterium]